MRRTWLKPTPCGPRRLVRVGSERVLSPIAMSRPATRCVAGRWLSWPGFPDSAGFDQSLAQMTVAVTVQLLFVPLNSAAVATQDVDLSGEPVGVPG